MRWLTWQQIHQFIGSWQGAFATALAILTAAYYGPKKMFETWDWYCDKFWDNEVLFLLGQRKITPARGNVINGAFTIPQQEFPHFPEEIANTLHRKVASIEKSLHRLWRKEKIEPYKGGWRKSP